METYADTTYGSITIVNRNPLTHDRRGYRAKPRLYVGVSDFNLLEDLENRTRRPYAAWRKLAEKVVAESGIPLDLRNMRWSQYAGCSCPCSPGFILRYQGLTLDSCVHTYYDVYIMLKDAPTVNPALPARQLVDA